MEETKSKPFVFVLMPFSQDFIDIYEAGIKPACREVGAYCERVDEQIFVENILHRVYKQIAKADIIVAEMTGRNPNVFYETGYAHALNKTVILLTQNADDIPFDLKHYPHIVYGGKIAFLKSQLEPRIRWCIDNPTEVSVPLKDLETPLNSSQAKMGDTDYPLHFYVIRARASKDVAQRFTDVASRISKGGQSLCTYDKGFADIILAFKKEIPKDKLMKMAQDFKLNAELITTFTSV
jgi:hypothetical protein